MTDEGFEDSGDGLDSTGVASCDLESWDDRGVSDVLVGITGFGESVLGMMAVASFGWRVVGFPAEPDVDRETGVKALSVDGDGFSELLLLRDDFRPFGTSCNLNFSVADWPNLPL
jgi:hypothetical protein